MTTQPQPPGIPADSDGLDFVTRARRRPGVTGWGTFFGMPFVWTIPFIILCGVIGSVSLMFLFPVGMGAVFTPLVTFVLIYALNRAVNDSRRQNGRIIIGYVDTAVRLNLPLIPFLTAAQLSERGRRASQLGHLCNAINAGLSVGSALALLPDVPAEAAGRIAAGEAMGQLRQSVRRSMELDRQVDEERSENPDGAAYHVYPLFVLLVSSTIVTGIMIFVIPKFKEIFKDFKTALPPSTERLLWFSSFLTEDTPLAAILLVAIVGIILLFVSMLLTNIFLPRFQLPAFSQIGQWLAWRFPMTRTLQRNEGMAETCELLASTIQEGATLPSALERAQMLAINPGFRAQLVQFRSSLLAGVPAPQAAGEAQLSPLLVGMLAMPSTSAESQSAMFAFLARHYRQRFSRSLLFIRSAIEPVMVLIMGALVGYILFALFSPLVVLIRSVMSFNDGGGAL